MSRNTRGPKIFQKQCHDFFAWHLSLKDLKLELTWPYLTLSASKSSLTHLTE